jgi:hypothetical protein
MQFINWLNQNQGFALSVLTLAYVICTAVIVVVMTRANTLARQGLRQAVDLERQRSRPVVIFDVELRPNYLLCGILKNIGFTAGYHIKVECEPALMNEFSNKPSTLTSTEIEFLAPQRRIADIVANVGRHHSEGERPAETVKGRVCYKDAAGNQYAEPFSIDLRQERKLVVFSEDRIANEIRTLSSTIKDIARRLGATR